jgi:hypothetical protein
MRVARFIGWLLIAGALAAVAYDLYGFAVTGDTELLVGGVLWFQLNSDSLNLAQAVVQRYIHPAIWDPGMIFLLTQPLALVLAVPGVLLVLLFRSRRRRRRFR